MASERILLADGPAEQMLAPGVMPIPLTQRQLADERQRRDARRHNGALPCGGLFDETAKAQGSLF